MCAHVRGGAGADAADEDDDDDDDDDAAAATELLRATLCDVRADFLRRVAGSATDAPADEDAAAKLLPAALAVRFKRS